MTRLISVNERIPIKIDGITIHVSPLTYLEKMQLQDYMMKAVNGNLSEAMKGAAMAIKFSVKDIEGVKDSQGYKYKLEFEENGRHLTDESVDNLLNLPQNNKIIATCSSLLEGIPIEGVKHPQTGKPLEGIVVETSKGKKRASKKDSGD